MAAVFRRDFNWKKVIQYRDVISFVENLLAHIAFCERTGARRLPQDVPHYEARNGERRLSAEVDFRQTLTVARKQQAAALGDQG
jgi:hypothetical protein